MVTYTAIFHGKSGLLIIHENVVKITHIGVFLKIYIDIQVFLKIYIDIQDMIRRQFCAQFCENRMSGKNRFLEILTKKY